MKGIMVRRLSVFFLIAALLMGMAVPASADKAGSKVVELGVCRLPAVMEEPILELPQENASIDPLEIVRVSIVLEQDSTLMSGFATGDIAQNQAAMEYNDRLYAQQQAMAERISHKVLGGKKLDVVWNLTLVGNIISANVPFGKISAIKALDGVAAVVMEQQFMPEETKQEEEAQPQLKSSGGIIGSHTAWSNGFTGAGSRIAVIDTGTDTNHQSLDAGAFLYALEQNAKAANMDYSSYVASLDLLDEEEIASVLTRLNAYERNSTLATASNLYGNEKLAYGFNYVDKNLDITHDNDSQGEHGSHVAGIATANRFIPKNGSYVDALSAVSVAGVAPDAQLITMKVFGTAGGAYESDYMAAIEDAIVLGCDSVNLSIGSTNPGYTYSSTYNDLQSFLATTDTVVVNSGGNNSYWSYQTPNAALYRDDVAFASGGSPGTYTNHLTVASLDSNSVANFCFRIGDQNFDYLETRYNNARLRTLDMSFDITGTEYPYVFLDAYGEPEDFAGIDVSGKIVLCSRGGISEFQKAENAVAAGAVATVVYNNVIGAFSMDLSDYTKTAPCVSITATYGKQIRQISQKHTAPNGTVYYTGTMLVMGGSVVSGPSSGHFIMSDFSSWGVPGNLSLKPEITAPGGYIRSISNAKDDGTAYSIKSGTSMAAPQVSGMTALMMQYIRENELDKKVSITNRALAQSLLMSTAKPMRERTSGTYYPILKQGSGLARVDLATSAKTYVLVDGQPDGKVKVELGDDPDRKGEYSFRFTLYNLDSGPARFVLSADLFTQAATEADGIAYHDILADILSAAVSFQVNGTVSNDTAQVTVPVNGSVDVEVTLTLPEETKNYLNETYPKGAFVEAYVFADAVADDAGNAGVSHSIPVLGFYGNWTEPSMYDLASYQDYRAGNETRTPYMYAQNANATNFLSIVRDSTTYYFGGNSYATDDTYLPQRNAMNNTLGYTIGHVYYTLIRNSIQGRLLITDTKTGATYKSSYISRKNSAYFNARAEVYENTRSTLSLNWAGTDASGKALADGTQVNISLIMAPEYYRNSSTGAINWDALGEGAYFTTPITIDNTAPTVQDLTQTGNVATVTALDSQYVAAVILYDGEGTELERKSPNQTTANTPVSISFDMNGRESGDYEVTVCDYAGNGRTYKISVTVHQYESVVTAPTCENKGYTTHTCTVCGDTYVDSYVDAAGHSYTSAVTAPTCTEKGYTTHTCSVCEDSYVDSYVDANGHSMGNWTTTTAPTCTEKGVERRDCAACDFFETREVEENGHSYVSVVTAPTCTEQGYTTHTCSVCEDSYVDSYVDANGHSMGNWTTTTAPTCTEKGEERRDCSVCDFFETRQVEENGHNYVSTVTAPTCTEKGYTAHTCSVCENSYVDSYVDAHGHEYEVTTAGNVETHTCVHCGDSYEVILETEPVIKNGIYLEDGLYYYYVDNKIQYSAGLVEVDGSYYYIRSGGYAATGSYWVTNTNGLTTQGFHLFGQDGKMVPDDSGKNGIYLEDGLYYYYRDGKIVFGAGLVEVDGNYYYIRSGGYAATGRYWVTTTNGITEEGFYDFGEDGKMLAQPSVKNGIYYENGFYYYYVDGAIGYSAGLVEVDGSYYYIRTGGYAATGRYWVTITNGLLPEGFYTFGEDGKMVEETKAKNGIYYEKGLYYYYVDDAIRYGAGLVEVDGSYYYIRTGGYAATGRYWVSVTNGLVPEGYYTFGEDGKMIP